MSDAFKEVDFLLDDTFSDFVGGGLCRDFLLFTRNLCQIDI